ncbi:MAG: GtrA family protein [Methylotenera sp.]|uniref:GtrA family protein n=1 Tax=Methylotenera sp. TaxID=2051956 RepID=UPI002489360B|nr:GtrA family protein [Methylotenera sp.]MDI1309467.1 GtrA family protein [Methylotenera sp.]
MTRKSIPWFAVIGASAAAVHYIAAVSIEFLQLATPAKANILGFLFAFPLSYFGHKTLSFAGHTATHRQAFPKFFSIAIVGFLFNQFIVTRFLTITILPFWLVLGVAMVIVAVLTYLFSHYWAFKGKV